MVWDGDCGFCGKWIARWKQATGDQVDYQTYQEAAHRFPEIQETAFAQAVHFIGLDGFAVRGAEAVFTCLDFAGRYSFLLGLYRRFASFARFSEATYGFVARHRQLFSRLTSCLWGRSVEYSTYRLSGSLFLRGLGLVYLIAFASFGMQASGLIGEEGIVPLGPQLEAAEHLAQERHGIAAAQLRPSILWLGDHTVLLPLCLWGGAAAATLLLLGVLPSLTAIICWIFYLSLVNTVPVFLSFQWDILLLEAGFIAIFFAPWAVREKLSAPREPPMLARWLVWWLLFRLMFESGLVKLLTPAGVDVNTWRELTALNFHYFTQPIPNSRSWFLHGLPGWFQQLSILVMLFVELVVPFLIIGPRRVRMLAFWLLAGFQVLIMASGNYGFFNLLTIVLCLSLVDDQVLPRPLRKWLQAPPSERSWQRKLEPLGWVRLPVTGLIFLVGALQLFNMLKVINLSDYMEEAKERTDLAVPFYHAVKRYHIVNTYGLFRSMTIERPELIIEGSHDGSTWHPYDFKYKPDAPDAPPPFLGPYMPRLDWQMWFAALTTRYSGGYPQWMGGLLSGLANNREPVLELLADNPFPDAPPTYLRVRLYDYTFSTPDALATSGQWWQRQLLPSYTRQFRSEIFSQDVKP